MTLRDDRLSLAQVARRLSVSLATVKVLVSRGQIRATGPHVRREDLERFLRRGVRAA